MDDMSVARIAALERRQRILLATNALALCLFAAAAIFRPSLSVKAPQKAEATSLTARSEADTLRSSPPAMSRSRSTLESHR
jgi:hypothetical protein